MNNYKRNSEKPTIRSVLDKSFISGVYENEFDLFVEAQTEKSERLRELESKAILATQLVCGLKDMAEDCPNLWKLLQAEEDDAHTALADLIHEEYLQEM